VREGVFGLALGAEWNAPDSILRIDADVRPDEIQFQPGVFLVKAGPVREEIARRGTPTQPPTPPEPTPLPGSEPGPEPPPGPKPPLPKTAVMRIAIALEDVPADKMRDVVKVVVLPLAASGATVHATIEIKADGPESGIPRETLDLTVLEGLRQLGLNPKVELEGSGE
jgi:hypothetical protein